MWNIFFDVIILNVNFLSFNYLIQLHTSTLINFVSILSSFLQIPPLFSFLCKYSNTSKSHMHTPLGPLNWQNYLFVLQLFSLSTIPVLYRQILINNNQEFSDQKLMLTLIHWTKAK